MYFLSPSMLASDYSRLGEEIRTIDEAGTPYIHVDIMDGNFVPSINFGMPVVRAFRKMTDKVLDVHLMWRSRIVTSQSSQTAAPISSRYMQRPAPIFTGPSNISVPLEKRLAWL